MLGRKRNNFAQVCKKLFWRAIYYTNTRPEPDSQSGSMSCKGLGIQALWIIHEYNLATNIAIQLLTQHHTWKMGSSIFDAMSGLKFTSTTRAYFPSMT